jgi:hypothetical protein
LRVKKLKNKYYSANEIKNMILNKKKLPRTSNQKGRRYITIAKVRGSIFGKAIGKKIKLK